MKRFHYLLPILALLIAVGWSVQRRHHLASLESSVATLNDRLKTPARAHPSSNPSWFRDAAGNPAKGDWQKIADSLRDATGSGWMTRSLQDQLALLSEEELIAGLDELASLDTPHDVRWHLRSSLLSLLARKNPEAALARVDLGDFQDAPFAEIAMNLWLATDPGRAIAWHEAMNSDSLSNKTATALESCMIRHLLTDDPEAAFERFHQLPRNSQDQFMANFPLNGLGESALRNWISFVREELPESQSSNVVLNHARKLQFQDRTNPYGAIDAFLGAIDSTPAERKEIVEFIGGTPLLTDRDTPAPALIDKLRDWADAQSPEGADIATARLVKSLQSTDRITYDEALDQVEFYYGQSNNGELIGAFFYGSDVSHLTPAQKDRAHALITRIPSLKTRNKLLDQLDP